MRDSERCCPLIQIALLSIWRIVDRTIFEAASRIITSALYLINPRRVQLPILLEAAFKTIFLIISLPVRACPIWDRLLPKRRKGCSEPSKLPFVYLLSLTDLSSAWPQ